MKKFSKIAILLASILSLIQLSASAAPYKGYPFLYEDFEDKDISYITANNAPTIEAIDGGYGNSVAALNVGIDKDYQSARFQLKLTEGQTYKVSCYIKPNMNLDATSVGFFMYFPQKMPDGSKGTGEGYAAITTDKLTLTKDKWIKLEKTYTFAGKANMVGKGEIDVFGDGQIELRVGDGKINNINGGKPFVYTIDDLCVEPIFTPSDVPDEEGDDFGGLIKCGSFEGKRLPDNWIRDNVTAKIVSGGANGTSKAVKVTGAGEFKQQIPLTPSHTYNFKGYIKGSEQSIGKNAKLIIDRNADGQGIEEYDIGVLSSDWQEFEFNYFKPLMIKEPTNPYMYISVEDSGEYYLDEISLKSEKNIIHNGDFSEEIGEYWIGNNADFELTDDIPDVDFTAENSMHITQTKPRGYVYQNIYLKPHTEYVLSFWAKGDSLDGKGIIPTIESIDKSYKIDLPTGDENFTSDWKYYETKFTTDIDIERLMKFYVLTSVNLQKRDFYLADIQLKENKEEKESQEEGGEGSSKKYDTPEIRNLSADGNLVENQSIQINAEYLGKNPQTGLVQMFKQAEDGGWASILTHEFTGEFIPYTFKTADIGQKLKIRIVPMDTMSNIGGYKELELEEVAKELEINKEFTSAFGSVITANTQIVNRSEQDEDIVCMLMLYDSDNSCVGLKYNAGAVYANTEKNYPIEISAADSAVKAKLFVWKGSSDVDTTMKSLSKAIILQK